MNGLTLRKLQSFSRRLRPQRQSRQTPPPGSWHIHQFRRRRSCWERCPVRRAKQRMKSTRWMTTINKTLFRPSVKSLKIDASHYAMTRSASAQCQARIATLRHQEAVAASFFDLREKYRLHAQNMHPHERYLSNDHIGLHWTHCHGCSRSAVGIMHHKKTPSVSEGLYLIIWKFRKKDKFASSFSLPKLNRLIASRRLRPHDPWPTQWGKAPDLHYRHLTRHDLASSFLKPWLRPW